MGVYSLKEYKVLFQDRKDFLEHFKMVPGKLWLLETNFELLESTNEFLDGLLAICGKKPEIEEDAKGLGKIEVEKESGKGLILQADSEVSGTKIENAADGDDEWVKEDGGCYYPEVASLVSDTGSEELSGDWELVS